MFGVCRTCLSCITNRTSARRIYRIYSLKVKRIKTTIGKYTKKLIIKLDIRQGAGKMLIMHIMEIIRCEVEKSPESRRQICIATGIDETAMHRIMERNGSCMAETADKLLTYFGYELKKKARRK
jgi:hypothetical protein